MPVEWNGLAVAKKMLNAEINGINVVMSQAVRQAKTNHEWINRTGILEGSIAINVYARQKGAGASGIWGSADVVYARAQELGYAEGNIPARPYLRPAADEKYPLLAGAIRKAFAK